MSRPSGPIWLISGALFGAAFGCLGDVPPFQGEGGATSTSATGATTAGTTSSDASVGSTSAVSTGADGGGPSSTGTGDGGAPAGPVSASSTSSGPVCDLDELPTTCNAALVELSCADLGHPEACDVIACPDIECAFPVAVFLADPREGYCTTAEDSVDETCLSCDGAGPGAALATAEPTGPLAIGTFAPGMPAVAKLVARGHGRFQLQWLVSEASNGSSEIFTLGDDFATFEVAPLPSTSFELRVLPTFADPLWIEIDCAYTVETASGGTATR